jgi:hypothetical protein
MLKQTCLAALLTVAAFGAATPAYADRCDRKLERLDQRFREIEARRGWEAASEWWNETGWPKYYDRCVEA